MKDRRGEERERVCVSTGLGVGVEGDEEEINTCTTLSPLVCTATATPLSLS